MKYPVKTLQNQLLFLSSKGHSNGGCDPIKPKIHEMRLLKMSVIKQLTLDENKTDFFLLLKQEAFLKEKQQITEKK